jgi:Rha family phage regulatory protein
MANTATTGTSAVSTSVTPDLTVIDGVIYTTSTQIAQHFNKTHRAVLLAIRNIIAMLPSGPLHNFVQGYYTLPETGDQQHALYRLNRYGFSLLAMGFTGKEAFQWKLTFLNTFERMEAELVNRAAQLPAKPVQLPPTRPMLINNAPSTTTLQLMLITTTHGQSTVEVLSADALPNLLMAGDGIFTPRQITDIAGHASMRMIKEVYKLPIKSEAEQLTKQVRTMHTTDLAEVAKQAYLELSLRGTIQGKTA